MNASHQITVYSRITDSEGEVNEMTLYTEATYKHERSKAYLMYEETEISGMAHTKTLVSYDGSAVQIKRFGENASVLKIENNTWHENLYQTPYGVFVMKTKGNRIEWNDAASIDVELNYTLVIEGSENASSEVYIKINSKRD